MSAAELRRAAETLRAQAQNASEGPWSPEPLYDLSVWGEARDDWQIVSIGTSGNPEDLRYIATMHPGVGLALADWLEDEAKAAGYHDNRVIPAALTIARLINGGAA